jgi:hypothetical protein
MSRSVIDVEACNPKYSENGKTLPVASREKQPNYQSLSNDNLTTSFKTMTGRDSLPETLTGDLNAANPRRH